VFHRSPTTRWDTENFYDAGFGLLRSANDTTPPVGATANPITGAQPLRGSTPIDPILGFGRESNDFSTKLPPGTTVISQVSPSWGDYATDPPSNTPGLFLAEGSYTIGTPPTITAARVQVYDMNFSAPQVDECLMCNPPFDPLNSAPTVVDAVVGPPYNANQPGEPQTLTHQLLVSDPDVGQTHTLDNLQLLSYTPNYGGTGTGPQLAPTLSPSGVFNWVSEGSPRGDYVWQVRATDNGVPPLSDIGTITVHVTHVPEPASVLLAFLAITALAAVCHGQRGLRASGGT
jgi:hypothetical protein